MQRQTCIDIFLIDIPISEKDNCENFIKETWLSNNHNIKNYFIFTIKEITLKSKLEIVQYKFNDFLSRGYYELKFECFKIYPGMCLNLNNVIQEDQGEIMGLEKQAQQKVILTINEQQIPVIKRYKKTQASQIFNVQSNNEYKDYYFVLEQIIEGFQAFDLTQDSGLISYDYPKKEIEPIKTNINIQKILDKNYPNLNEYSIVSDYSLADFKKYFKDKKQIIVPRVRLDKTILVSKQPIELKNIVTEETYENLYWLIQLQQEFINSCLQQNQQKSTKVTPKTKVTTKTKSTPKITQKKAAYIK